MFPPRFLFIFGILAFSLGGCAKMDETVGSVTSKITPINSNEAIVETNKTTGLVQPSAAANKKQAQDVRQSIGKRLDFNFKTSQSCDIKTANKLVGKEFKSIPTRSLPRNFRLIRPNEKVSTDKLTGRVNLKLNEQGKVTKVYCG
ncbi:MAG: I78 family peptidase inhibitor [Alphaproteobacteria bacterium]